MKMRYAKRIFQQRPEEQQATIPLSFRTSLKTYRRELEDDVEKVG